MSEYIKVESRFNLTKKEYGKLIRISDEKDMEVGEVIEAMVMAGIKHTVLKELKTMSEKAQEVMVDNYAFLANQWFQDSVKHCHKCDHDECTLYHCFRDFLKNHGYENVKIDDLIKFVNQD